MRDDVKGGVHKLVPMHRTPAEKKKNRPGLVEASESGEKEYGYGTRLELGEEEHEKLGLSGPHPVGSMVAVHARARVVSAGTHEDGGGKRRSMSLQLTHVGLGTPQPAAPAKKIRRLSSVTPPAPKGAVKVSRIKRA